MNSFNKLEYIYPISSKVLNKNKSNEITLSDKKLLTPNRLLKEFKKLRCKLPVFISELLNFEWNKHKIDSSKRSIPDKVNKLTINPVLNISNVSWDFTSFINIKNLNPKSKPQKKNIWIIIWRDPKARETKIKTASPGDLLILKIISENIDPRDAAKSHKMDYDRIENIIDNAESEGIILSPKSKLKRNTGVFLDKNSINESFLSAKTFTLQWHITHSCDLHCKHCYDRTKRSSPSFEQGIKILNDLEKFCDKNHVKGHVCFTGGNPFLYKHFVKLYKAAVDKGFSVSILANPVSETKVREITKIQYPAYFQVSLEGLKDNNDFIRGNGHFDRTLDFLSLLKKMDISSGVMLTLTKDNYQQIIPLACKLKKYTDHFTFNRLSQVGKGAALELPGISGYGKFLESYVKESKTNKILDYKDNLINTVLIKNKTGLFDGCTGFGCGAAFNFLVVLPDGEVHACRKYPSPLGNIFHEKIDNIYNSALAEKYRKGARECWKCKIKYACGGCMAITYSRGLNIFKNRDPFCPGIIT